MTRIHSAAVLGAGTMGAQIAAHLANAGIPVLLLDLDTKTAVAGLRSAQEVKPDPFFTRKAADLVSVGGFETDLPKVAACDWIIEAVVERLETKQQLMAQVETHRSASAIVSSNTSGIPIAQIANGRSLEFRQHWLGTHFFNPPRYLHLVEIIPTDDTNTAVVNTIRHFSDYVLGKGVVIAKDTPGFIANRTGLYGAMRTLEFLISNQFTIEEIDAMTGPVIGRPKSATFRTMDISGIDILAKVTRDLSLRLEQKKEGRLFQAPALIEELVRRGWIGSKVQQGFYKKEHTPEGNRILVLDPATVSYREWRAPQLPALDAAWKIHDVRHRVRKLFLGNDRVGEFLRATLGQTILYAAEVTSEMAHSFNDVDRAMRWGYGWDLGPFELLEVIGVDQFIEACQFEKTIPLAQNINFSREPSTPDLQILRLAKTRQPVVKQNAGASLIDLDDGVLAIEFHSKMNTLGGDAVEMLQLGVQEAEENFHALVVGNDATAFSAGANLTLVLLEAQEQNWDEIELMVRAFQAAVTGLLHARVPVVVAPAGLTLGGGCEIALHADRVQAAAETYMGQVEVGVGLIPAGGGTKELLARSMAQLTAVITDPMPFVRDAFELIGLAKVSTSAEDAKRLGLLREIDSVTMNRERLLCDAKASALELAQKGYQPPRPRHDIVVGGASVRATLELGVHLARRAGQISDHDALIGRILAHILSGGDLPHQTEVSEQYLLDLECEAFLSLCGEEKTQQRMVHTLKTGKTLRN